MNTIFTILGWLCFIVGWTSVSGMWLATAFNTLGQYNIGGVPNKWYNKIIVILFLIPVCYGWYWIFFEVSPFKLELK